MTSIVKIEGLTKLYGDKAALNGLTLDINRQRVVGLIGQNGSGKTTLLDTIAGMVLPTEGSCLTLGCPGGELTEELLAHLGVVHQENHFLDWMSVAQHLAYFGSFYKKWDVTRQMMLLKDLDLNPRAKVGHLSGGDIQKLGVITAVSHHPRLLLLDEPLSALDPIARETLLKFILRLLDEDEVTMIISSHALRDVERLMDWVVCLSEGNLRANSTFDALQERYAEWHVTSVNGSLPAVFSEPFIREQYGDERQARIIVEHAHTRVEEFAGKYQAAVKVSPMNLERIYPLLVKSSA